MNEKFDAKRACSSIPKTVVEGDKAYDGHDWKVMIFEDGAKYTIWVKIYDGECQYCI
jgi:hypothetical protein